MVNTQEILLGEPNHSSLPEKPCPPLERLYPNELPVNFVTESVIRGPSNCVVSGGGDNHFFSLIGDKSLKYSKKKTEFFTDISAVLKNDIFNTNKLGISDEDIRNLLYGWLRESDTIYSGFVGIIGIDYVDPYGTFKMAFLNLSSTLLYYSSDNKRNSTIDPRLQKEFFTLDYKPGDFFVALPHLIPNKDPLLKRVINIFNNYPNKSSESAVLRNIAQSISLTPKTGVACLSIKLGEQNDSSGNSLADETRRLKSGQKKYF